MSRACHRVSVLAGPSGLDRFPWGSFSASPEIAYFCRVSAQPGANALLPGSLRALKKGDDLWGSKVLESNVPEDDMRAAICRPVCNSSRTAGSGYIVMLTKSTRRGEWMCFAGRFPGRLTRAIRNHSTAWSRKGSVECGPDAVLRMFSHSEKERCRGDCFPDV